MKACTRCKKNKDDNQFPMRKRKSGLQVLHSHCTPCRNRASIAANKKLKLVNPYKYYRKLWNDNLRHNYSITVDQYEDILYEQDSKCALCGGGPNGKGRLHVDHDHETKVIRGLLCHSCNTGIGLLNDDVELLQKAIIYLTKHKKAIA